MVAALAAVIAGAVLVSPAHGARIGAAIPQAGERNYLYVASPSLARQLERGGHGIVKRLLVTHVLAAAIRATPNTLRRKTELGAMLELTLLTHSPGAGGAINVGRLVAVSAGAQLIKSLGAENVVISSDLGQRNNPPHPDGLRALFPHFAPRD